MTVSKNISIKRELKVNERVPFRGVHDLVHLRIERKRVERKEE